MGTHLLFITGLGRILENGGIKAEAHCSGPLEGLGELPLVCFRWLFLMHWPHLAAGGHHFSVECKPSSELSEATGEEGVVRTVKVDCREANTGET